MSEQQTIDLNLIELVNLAAKILNQLFIKAPKEKAKPIFKDIKQGKAIALGTVKIHEALEPSLQLALDYSEFRGPGFNFNIFEMSLKSILQQISQKFQTRADLNVMTSEEGSVLIHLPGIIQSGEQLNAMVMAFELGNMTNITIKLMFVDPEQYESIIKERQES